MLVDVGFYLYQQMQRQFIANKFIRTSKFIDLFWRILTFLSKIDANFVVIEFQMQIQ